MLYIVGTPIGNYLDISERAKEVLRSVDLIACEDTRETGILMKAIEAQGKLISYHEHNRAAREKTILENLSAGKDIALVSDAGMPCISDPGVELVRLCVENNIPVTSIPGPTAFVTALSLSGIDTRRFTFEGFIPAEGKERKARLRAIMESEITVVIYEAPHRLIKTLSEMISLGMGGREVAVSRELTKKYEQVIRGTVAEAATHFSGQAPKGEFVLVIGKPVSENFVEKVAEEKNIDARIIDLADQGFSTREISSILAEELSVSKNVIYSKALMVLKYRKEQKG
ncbi:MAG: 16S rRNA (cytidine(1402)-2'-O)-methyltransferase [Clostridiaceae bacterium]|jgi:16S rRNA (cytidine1402-2'-O)-methyltransferase|nr:16S rRNA (cytidine(1402)-2'-O)-methyltransferase [Oscillospiraceae bacterium]NLO63563.1 16S rRNA (cytidine(1402)-2'-O)-methyltransferase [Clostridiaceae bacterium]